MLVKHKCCSISNSEDLCNIHYILIVAVALSMVDQASKPLARPVRVSSTLSRFKTCFGYWCGL